jgi:tetratricopeptide (TPR) repeat protein
MASNQAKRYLLLHGKQVVGYIRPGAQTELPPQERALLEQCDGDLTQFALALGNEYQLLEVSLEESDYPQIFTADSLNDRRKYYLFHNGEIVGVMTAAFHNGEFATLVDEEGTIANLPEILQAFWLKKDGDLNQFLQGLEEEERRYNYLEALDEETPQELEAEFESDKVELTRHWERGLAMRDRFLFLRALRELEIAAALCDKYAMVDFLAELCNEMGNLYIAFEDYDSAAEVFEEGLAYRPTDLVSRVRLLTNLSQAYDLAEKRKQAIERVEEALSIIPPDIYDSLLAGVYSQAASLYNQEGNFDKAIQFYKLASYLANHSKSVSDQEKAMFHNNLGMAYLEHGDFHLALEQLKSAVALQPQDPFYQENLVRSYDQLK